MKIDFKGGRERETFTTLTSVKLMYKISSLSLSVSLLSTVLTDDGMQARDVRG